MTAPFLIPVILLGLAAVTIMLIPIRRVTRTGGLRPSWETPAEPEPEYDAEPVPLPQLPRRASTPRGIRPPASPHLTMLQVSPECAEGMCGICPRTGGCQCSCDHDPVKIVARNAAEYDRTHGKAPA